LKDTGKHNKHADVILNCNKQRQEQQNNFHYQSIIGQLSYLSAMSKPEIHFAVFQCAQFCKTPKMSHKKTVKGIIQYLKKTKDQGLIMKVNKDKGIKCFAKLILLSILEKKIQQIQGLFFANQVYFMWLSKL
jgi:hypothetical protein